MKIIIEKSRERKIRSRILKKEVQAFTGERIDHKTVHGKPLLKNSYFNLSHSDLISVGVIYKEPIGIDIEKLCEINISNVIRNEEDIDIQDIKLHVIKESVAKLIGLGLNLNFKEIVVKNDSCYIGALKIKYEEICIDKQYICYVSTLHKERV